MQTTEQIIPEGCSIVDDYYVVNDDGEIVGYTKTVDPAAIPDSKEIVQAYLKRRAFAESKKKALEHQKNLLIAGIVERFETQIRAEERKIEWEDNCNKQAAEAWAKEKLEFSKTKSLKLDFGTMGFRSCREKITIIDQGEAVIFCKQKAPHALNFEVDPCLLPASRQEEILNLLIQPCEGIEAAVIKSRIPDDLKSELPSDAFEYRPAGSEQEFYIKHDAKGEEDE